MNRDDDEDDKKNPDSGETPASPPGFASFLLGQMLGGGAQAVAIQKVQASLGGAVGEQAFIDGLRTQMREKFNRMSTLAEKIEAVRRSFATEEDYRAAVAGNLKCLIEERETQWSLELNAFATETTYDHILWKRKENVDRHDVQQWFLARVCLCSGCWKK